MACVRDFVNCTSARRMSGPPVLPRRRNGAGSSHCSHDLHRVLLGDLDFCHALVANYSTIESFLGLSQSGNSCKSRCVIPLTSIVHADRLRTCSPHGFEHRPRWCQISATLHRVWCLTPRVLTRGNPLTMSTLSVIPQSTPAYSVRWPSLWLISLSFSLRLAASVFVSTLLRFRDCGRWFIVAR